MAYSLLTAVTSHDSLIDQLETFLAANGWTIDASSEGPPRVLDISRSIGGLTCYYRLSSNTGSSLLTLIAYTGAAQANPSNAANITNISNTVEKPRIHLFSSSQAFYAVVQNVAGEQPKIFGFGRLSLIYPSHASDPTGTYVIGHQNLSSGFFPGFSYTSRGSSNNGGGSVRVYTDSGNVWHENNYTTDFYHSSGASSNWFTRSRYNITGLRAMFPIGVYASLTSPTRDFMVGVYPDLRMLSGYRMNNEQEVVVGSDTWVLFSVFGGTGTLFMGSSDSSIAAIKK